VNKDLYGKYYEVEKSQLDELEKFRGEKTIDNILNTKKISYSNLKRLKNRMENGEMDSLGGSNFHNWINQTLGGKRRDIHTSKEIKKNNGESNAFLSPHEKRKAIRPSETHRKSSEKYDTWNDNSTSFLRLESRVINELKLINNLIKLL
jgi:hypothetical protein